MVRAWESGDRPVISVAGLTKSFGKVRAVRGIDLDVARGSVLALLGPNGAGKTTTVRILSTLLRPDTGRVTVGGHDVVLAPEKVQALIGLAGQSVSVDDRLTGTQNLVMLGRLYRLDRKDARARAAQLIEGLTLSEAANRLVRTYSGGMRRKLDLAASLIAAPPVLFLDEPTAGLDPASRMTLWEVIRELVRDGTTVLLTTQYLEEADQLAGTVAVIDGGRLTAHGTPAELKARAGTAAFELTAATADDFDRLRLLLPAQLDAAVPDTRTVSFRADDTGVGGLRSLREIIDTVLAAGIAVDGYATRQPTLDDAFLQLTGHGPGAAADGKPMERNEA